MCVDTVRTLYMCVHICVCVCVCMCVCMCVCVCVCVYMCVQGGVIPYTVGWNSKEIARATGMNGFY